MNRFISLMPSSMCCPLGSGSQRSSLGTAVAGACHGFSAHTPVRLTQPPRLVEIVTSGLAVTMRSASGPSKRASSTSAFPKTSCVEMLAGTRLGNESGTSDARTGSAATAGRGPCGYSRAERSEEHTSELQSRRDLVCRLLLEKKKKKNKTIHNIENKN